MSVALAGWPRIRRRWWLAGCGLAGAATLGVIVAGAAAPGPGPEPAPQVSVCGAGPLLPAPPPPPPPAPIRVRGKVTAIGPSERCDPAAPTAALGSAHHARVVIDVSGDASLAPTAGVDPHALPVLVPCPELARAGFRRDSGNAGPLRVGASYGWVVQPHPTDPWQVEQIRQDWICRLPHPYPRGGRGPGQRAREGGGGKGAPGRR